MKDLEVALGDSKDISGKISELSDMMPELEGKKGILYLDTYDPVKSAVHVYHETETLKRDKTITL